MEVDLAADATARTEAAQRLLDEARDAGQAELVVIYVLELCPLGGPRHALCDEAVALAWTQMRKRRRAKAIELTTAGLVERGLLSERIADTETAELSGRSYSLDPALGLVLAARSRPAYIVVTEIEGRRLRTARLFALGDRDEPVRGLVLEVPEKLPSDDAADDFPHVERLGPLGWLYRYLLVSQATAVRVLAEWALPALLPSQMPSARVVSIYRHYDAERPVAAMRVRLRGDGTSAQLLVPNYGDDQVVAEHDEDGLRSLFADLLDAAAP